MNPNRSILACFVPWFRCAFHILLYLFDIGLAHKLKCLMSGDDVLRVRRAILTAEQAVEIYQLRPHHITIDGGDAQCSGRTLSVARRFGISPKAVRDIWNRRSWASETSHLWAPGECPAVRSRRQPAIDRNSDPSTNSESDTSHKKSSALNCSINDDGGKSHIPKNLPQKPKGTRQVACSESAYSVETTAVLRSVDRCQKLEHHKRPRNVDSSNDLEPDVHQKPRTTASAHSLPAERVSAAPSLEMDTALERSADQRPQTIPALYQRRGVHQKHGSVHPCKYLNPEPSQQSLRTSAQTHPVPCGQSELTLERCEPASAADTCAQVRSREQRLDSDITLLDPGGDRATDRRDAATAATDCTEHLCPADHPRPKQIHQVPSTLRSQRAAADAACEGAALRWQPPQPQQQQQQQPPRPSPPSATDMRSPGFPSAALASGQSTAAARRPGGPGEPRGPAGSGGPAADGPFHVDWPHW